MSDIIQKIWDGAYVPIDEFDVFKILMDEHFNLLSAELGRTHSEGFKLAIRIMYESISGHNQELIQKIFDLAYDTYEKAEEKE